MPRMYEAEVENIERKANRIPVTLTEVICNFYLYLFLLFLFIYLQNFAGLNLFFLLT